MNQDIFVIVEHLQGQVMDISYVMLAAARRLVTATGGAVVAVLLGHENGDLAADFAADKVLYIDHPSLAGFTSDAYLRVLIDLIGENQPRAILMGHTSVGMDIAGGLSVKLGLPLISQCKDTGSANGDLNFTSQICGGKIMVEGDFPNTTLLLTFLPGAYSPEDGKSAEAPEMITVDAPSLEGLRLSVLQYIEPEAGDVDISKEPVLIAVGRGLQSEDDIELVQELADALGGAVCASRPIVDLGWLPTSRMVGKSGRSVRPKLYLALGISGAPEHVEGIADCDMLIAVNTDPTAPIFDSADYGADADAVDLLEVLIEQVEEAQGG